MKIETFYILIRKRRRDSIAPVRDIVQVQDVFNDYEDNDEKPRMMSDVGKSID